MAFTPTSPLNITYKKYAGIVSKSIVSFDILAYTTRLYITGAPTWLNVGNGTFSGTTGKFTVEMREAASDNLAAGTYTANIRVKGDLQEPDMIEPSLIDYGTYQVTVTIVNTIILEVTPSALNFAYDPAVAPPVEKLVRITTENDWIVTKSASWITTTATNGTNSASIYVGVDAAALAFGFYEGKVVVNDGFFTRTVNVYLVVQAPATSNDYLYVNPQTLEFLSEVSVVNNVDKNIEVDSTATWSVVSSETWLNTDLVTGPSGLTAVAVSVDSAALLEGAYFANLEFSAAGIVTKIFVSLRVVSFALAGITNDTLYFADDRNQLNVGSVSDNSFLLLEVLLSSIGESESYYKEQPYFRGIASAVIGLETSRFLKQYTPSTNKNSRILNNIAPVKMALTAYEKHRFSGYTPTVANYENLYFLKGKTPKVTNRASYIPSQITVTNQALIALSVISETAPTQINITGAITQTILGGLQDGKYIYTALVNLASYVLVDKDEITISFDAKTINVQIDNTFIERNTIAFENEWSEFEFFETKGFFVRTAEVDQQQTNRATDGQTKTIILEADEDESFTLNTGYIQTWGEVNWLSKILFAKQVFIWIDNDWLPVILTNKNMQVYETRNHIHSYNLQFKKAIV